MKGFDLSNVEHTISISEFFWDTINGMFTYPVEKQKSFLQKLGPGKDDFDRSYKQYLCQRELQQKWKVVLLNVVFFFVYPCLIIFAGVRSLFIKQKDVPFDAIAAVGIKRVIPNELALRFNFCEDAYFKGMSLNVSDIIFSLSLFFRYPLSPFFVTKSTLKLACYSFMISSFRPKAIIVMNEYSYTSSFLTAYCEKKGVKHIDVLHGEKFFYFRDAYFRYHECWVWGEYYKKLFLSLNVADGQFQFAIPPFLKIDCEKYVNKAIFANYKYYLQSYNTDQIKQIVDSMRFVKEEGKTIKYRPHPIWSNLALLKEFVPENEIENPKEVSIMESISNLEYAVGSFSTVLNQADYSGKKVILDDIAFKNVYEKLKEVQYILCEKNHPGLSMFQQ